MYFSARLRKGVTLHIKVEQTIKSRQDKRREIDTGMGNIIITVKRKKKTMLIMIVTVVTM